MNPIKIIRRVQWRHLWSLLGLSIRHVFFLWPTYRATRKCMELSTEHFGKKHYQNGPANAFRHALWNVLIAHYCLKVARNLEKVLTWTKAITDWHEQAFFGKELPMQMDYHNNEVGRYLFEQHPRKTVAYFVTILLQMTESAHYINKESSLESFKNQLVYITKDA